MNENSVFFGENGRRHFEEYEEEAEQFQSDTRRYLREHLLDEYANVSQAIEYNLIQNVWDNHLENKPLTIKFSYSSKEKRLQFIASGYKGIKDWERYNRLHAAGVMGSIRRGEGAKVLVPVAEIVRTETHPDTGEYIQAIWMEDKIWRSDRPSERRIFDDHFPPSAIPAGTTVITAEGVYDEVGDRKAGLELANGREMTRLIRNDWDLLLRKHPEVVIIYEVDGVAEQVRAWEYPEIADKEIVADLPVVDHAGEQIGIIEEMALFLSKAPLKDAPPAAISVCTDLHAVTYQAIYGGPNANRLFGYVRASFLAESETTNHLSFKSTRAYRLVRDIIAKEVDDFMRQHVGLEKVIDPRTAKLLADVTGQVNQLIREKFPDWHPEGGFVEKRKTPPPRTTPWIRNPRTNAERYQAGQNCLLSFEVVNPNANAATGQLEARITAVYPDGTRLHHQVWAIEVPADDSRLLSVDFEIPADAPAGTYLSRVSLVDATRSPLHDRKISFEVGEEFVEEDEEEPTKTRSPRKTRKVRIKRGDALRNPSLANFPEEDGKIRESALDRNDLMVYLNKLAPSYTYAITEEKAFRYHAARCQIEELAQLKFERDLGLLEPDELTKQRITTMIRDLELEKSTFIAEWARLEGIRTGKLAEPLAR